MNDGPLVAVALESRPQSLTLVRGVLTGVAELLGMDAELLDDVKTAVSEACNNVVLHAYAAATGSMEVAIHVDERDLRVIVGDRGCGLPTEALDARPDRTAEALQEATGGIGLSIIRALTRETRLMPRPGGGTEVSMRFAVVRDGHRLLDVPPPAAMACPAQVPATLRDGEVGLALAAPSLISGVLGRLARTLAATAHFSLDRFSDVYLVADTLAALAQRSGADGPIVARISAAERRLQIALEPFAPGAGAAITARRTTDHLTSPLALLADEIAVQVVDDGGQDRTERIEVVVLDRRD